MEYLSSSAKTLTSLTQLMDKVKNMIIDDNIRAEIENALRNSEEVRYHTMCFALTLFLGVFFHPFLLNFHIMWPAITRAPPLQRKNLGLSRLMVLNLGSKNFVKTMATACEFYWKEIVLKSYFSVSVCYHKGALRPHSSQPRQRSSRQVFERSRTPEINNVYFCKQGSWNRS